MMMVRPRINAPALRLWLQLAEQGDADAQFNLSDIYEYGRGVRQDGGAVRWFRKAAEHDFADAQNNLGARYDNGEGVPQDHVSARMWLNLAAAQGDDTAQKNRDIVAKRMTPCQIAKAERMAREWMEKHP